MGHILRHLEGERRKCFGSSDCAGVGGSKGCCNIGFDKTNIKVRHLQYVAGNI